MNVQVVNAKITLYRALLGVSHDTIADHDVDLMATLAADPDIQLVLNAALIANKLPPVPVTKSQPRHNRR